MQSVAVPSSASCVVTWKGTASPQVKKPPFSGYASVTSGAWLPTEIAREVSVNLPSGSVTLSRAV